MNPDQRHEQFMAVSLFSFLDNIISPARSINDQAAESTNQPPTPPPRTDIEAGGYPEEMFLFLTDKEKEEYSCSVCYSILKDAHQCKNNHKFCYTCVYVWSTSPGDGSEFCPMCRIEGLYARNDIINTVIGRKRVKCQKTSCNWLGRLNDYETHTHRRYDEKELNKDFSLPAINSLNKGRVPITSVVESSHMSTSDFMRSLNRENTNTSTNGENPPRSSTPRLNPILLRSSSSSNSTNSTSAVSSVSSSTATVTAPPSRPTVSSVSSSTATVTAPPSRPTVSSVSSSTATVTTPSNRPTPTPPPTRRNSDSSTASIDSDRRNSIGPRRIVRPNEQSTQRPSISDNRSNSQRRDSLNRRDSVTSNSGNNSSGPVNRPGLIPRPPAQTRPRTQNQPVNPSNRPIVATRQNTVESVDTAMEDTATASRSSVSTTSSSAGNLDAIHFSTASSSSSTSTTTVSSSTNRPVTPPAQRQLPPNPPVDSNSGSSGEMIFRRLAPVRPRRTQAQVGERLREGREQLALMLTLMTLELEERRRNIERHARENQERERIRMEEIAEVHQLNRRLSVVTNNLERLLDSNQSRASSPPTLPSSSTETRSRNSSLPPPARQRLDIRFTGIGGIGGMSDSDSDE